MDMLPIFRTLLGLQDALNCTTVGPKWTKSVEQDWFLAISQECAEGIDHLAWKWWAKQTADLAAAQMEVVDILHFLLAAEMWVAPDGFSRERIAEILDESYKTRYTSIEIDEVAFVVAEETPIELFKLTSALATVGRTEIGVLFLLGEKLGLSEEALIRLYQQKATLNLFRQRHGYRTGAYVKYWAPSTEDNAFLPILSDGLDWTNPLAADALYQRLVEKYSEVVGINGKAH